MISVKIYAVLKSIFVVTIDPNKEIGTAATLSSYFGATFLGPSSYGVEFLFTALSLGG